MIKVGWGNIQQDYLIWCFKKDWTQADYDQAFDRTAQLISSRKDVPILVDMREVSKEDLLSMAYQSLEYGSFLTNRVVFVYDILLTKPVYSLLSTQLIEKGIDVTLVETIDEAYKVIIKS